MEPQTFIFIGRSGCGKGTQAELLKSFIKQKDTKSREIFYVETGAKFRDFIKANTYTSNLSRQVYERFERQPDFLAVWMWAHLFVENMTGEEHVVVDGAPRSLPEASVMTNAFDFYGRTANVIYINISRESSERRLLARGRDDDSTAIKIKKRLDWFDTDAVPAVEFFKKHPTYNFIEVNGELPKEQVHAEIVSKLQFAE